MTQIHVLPMSVSEICDAEGFADLANSYRDEIDYGCLRAPVDGRFQHQVFESAGLLRTAGAFADGKLVGFVSVMVTPSVHVEAKIVTVDSLFLDKRYRRGSNGLQLLKWAIQVATDEGSSLLVISAPVGSRLEKLLSLIGKKTESVFEI